MPYGLLMTDHLILCDTYMELPMLSISVGRIFFFLEQNLNDGNLKGNDTDLYSGDVWMEEI